ncbi:unnamed protein product [Didymodactylos carnosus]|uniref:Uncharacterized protein n=1 Tax=Didymodactylos carnosus TaxID=1234261 RepID=A0A8S2EF29_9BILA|nr:unnamed protein product [Didymodactylos carnosus]CAF3948367.1 unnamed protein product [Didymodactylos carnosus]
MMANFDCMGEPLERDSEVNYLVERGVIEHLRVAYYLRRVPLPPAQYIFSYQQRQQQRFFFRNLVNNVYDGSPYCPMDLYQYKIIVVLPDGCPKFLRYILETLFIIHGETELNMICPLGGSPHRRYGCPYQRDYFRYVGRPPTILFDTTNNPCASNMITTL